MSVSGEFGSGAERTQSIIRHVYAVRSGAADGGALWGPVIICIWHSDTGGTATRCINRLAGIYDSASVCDSNGDWRASMVPRGCFSRWKVHSSARALRTLCYCSDAARSAEHRKATFSAHVLKHRERIRTSPAQKSLLKSSHLVEYILVTGS